MARLNVEPEFFADSRFLDLVSLTADKEKAVGMVILFWMLAQKCWANGRELVPLEVFKRHKWEQLVTVGLAEIRDNGVYAKGSSQFEWILERKEAGKRGASKTNGLRYGKTQQTSAKLDKSQPLLCSTAATTLKDNIYVDTVDVPDKYPVKKLAELWNLLKAPVQPMVVVKTLVPKSVRYRSAKARLTENPLLTYWEDIIRRIAASPFCRGEVQIRRDSNPWVADFTWLIQTETHIKVFEGRYDHRVLAPKNNLELFTGEI